MGEHGKDTMCDFVLRKHSVDEIDLHLKKDPFLISTEDMRMLLEIIHQREVVFTERAEHLLKKYYIVSRVLQPSKNDLSLSLFLLHSTFLPFIHFHVFYLLSPSLSLSLL